MVRLTTSFVFSLFASVLSAANPEFPVICTGTPFQLLVYGEHTDGCAIAPSSETDTFSFEGEDGHRVRIMLQTTTALDPRIVIRDPTGEILVDSVCSGACSLEEYVDLLATGLYVIEVSDDNGFQSGSYTLALDRIPPETSCPIDYGITVVDAIAPTVDMDFFTFPGVSGTEISFTLLTTTALDPRVEIVDPLGATIYQDVCSGACSLTPNLVLAETGTYQVMVADDNGFQSGEYSIDIECLFPPGLCPPGPLDFVRGDCNGDDMFDIGDPVFLLDFLFVPGSSAPGCRDACDGNDDGALDIADAVFVLVGLFSGSGPLPPAPHPDCGVDPTGDLLTCFASGCP